MASWCFCLKWNRSMLHWWPTSRKRATTLWSPKQRSHWSPHEVGCLETAQYTSQTSHGFAWVGSRSSLENHLQTCRSMDSDAEEFWLGLFTLLPFKPDWLGSRTFWTRKLPKNTWLPRKQERTWRKCQTPRLALWKQTRWLVFGKDWLS